MGVLFMQINHFNLFILFPIINMIFPAIDIIIMLKKRSISYRSNNFSSGADGNVLRLDSKKKSCAS